MAFLISFVGDRRGGGFGRPFFLPKPLSSSLSSLPWLAAASTTAFEEVIVFGCEEVVGVELICGVPTFWALVVRVDVIWFSELNWNPLTNATGVLLLVSIVDSSRRHAVASLMIYIVCLLLFVGDVLDLFFLWCTLLGFYLQTDDVLIINNNSTTNRKMYLCYWGGNWVLIKRAKIVDRFFMVSLHKYCIT